MPIKLLKKKKKKKLLTKVISSIMVALKAMSNINFIVLLSLYISLVFVNISQFVCFFLNLNRVL